jgi:protein SCO1/2
MRRKRFQLRLAAGFGLAALAGGVPAMAGPFDLKMTPPPPPEVGEATVDEKPNAALPLDAAVRDEAGRAVTLGQYFGGSKPVVLILGYYGCPMLCGLVANGLADGLRGVDLLPGRDYEVVFVSIDPTEGPELAAQKKQAYLSAYGRPESADGWHFLTGDVAATARIADAAGFRYRWIESAKQYAHPAVLVVATPGGAVSRYLYGVKFDPATVRLSLVEASNGRVGSTTDRFLLTCFKFDGKQGKYALTAIGLMKVGGGVTLGLAATGCGGLGRRARRRPRGVGLPGASVP